MNLCRYDNDRTEAPVQVREFDFYKTASMKN